MIEISTNTQIGLGLTGMGMTFIFLGIVLLFDKGLLAIGNIRANLLTNRDNTIIPISNDKQNQLMFLAGICFLTGFRKTFSFFFQMEKAKGTLAFFAGIIILFSGHPIIGIIIELVGFYFLFRSFLPTAFQYVTSYVPFFSVVKNRSIV